MKFKVSGQNRETGGRMTLEFEADSKAAAERKAASAGMYVNRVEQIGDTASMVEPLSNAKRAGRGLLPRILAIAIVIAAAAAAWHFWPTIRSMMHQ